MKSAKQSRYNRYLILAALCMVAVQGGIALLPDFAPPRLASGAYQAEDPSLPALAPFALFAPDTGAEKAGAVAAGPAADLRVARNYTAALPDFTAGDAAENRRQFIEFLLPIVLEVNHELRDRRREIKEAARQGDMRKLKAWAKRYKYEITTPDPETISHDLLERVAPVPVSIALAQAAIESGWGTSRFAREGNALFGQRTTSRFAGISAAGDKNVRVRTFSHPVESVRSYMHNLNVHHFYDDFRARRAGIIDDVPEARHIRRMAEGLVRYSIERDDYVRKLLAVIDRNDLRQYDGARLASAER